MELTDEDEYTRIRQLPVLRELEQKYGPPPFKYLAGAPVRGASGRTRMPWVWFVDGQNFNLCVDHGGEWPWSVRAAGRAGHVHLTMGAGGRVTHTMLRAVCVAAGLLDPDTTTAQEEPCKES